MSIKTQFVKNQIITGAEKHPSKKKQGEFIYLVNVLDDSGRSMTLFVSEEVYQKTEGLPAMKECEIMYEVNYFTNREGQNVCRLSLVDIA